MIKIKLIHGSLWINPHNVASIEEATVETNNGERTVCFISLVNGSGWNCAYFPDELARIIHQAKAEHA